MSMYPTIHLIKAKLSRANRHIRDFGLASKAFNDSVPYSVAFKENRTAGKRIYYLSRVDPLPIELATIAADVLQNLRSALDQTAFQMELVGNGGAEPKHRVYFPIANGAAEYPRLRTKYLRFMRQDAADAIDLIEPYKGGKGHALWQLNKLSNADKHKLLIATGAYTRGVDVSHIGTHAFRRMCVPITLPPLFIGEVSGPVGLSVGDALFIDAFEHQVQQDLKIVCDVSFDYPAIIQREPAIKTLHNMETLVNATVARLEPFL